MGTPPYLNNNNIRPSNLHMYKDFETVPSYTYIHMTKYPKVGPKEERCTPLKAAVVQPGPTSPSAEGPLLDGTTASAHHLARARPRF